MDLIAERIEVGNPDVEVNSNKHKSAVVMLAVLTNVFARHKAHIRIEDQRGP